VKGHLYIIGFRWITAAYGKAEEVEKVLDPLGNWARLNVHTWLFWSSAPLHIIDQALEKVIKKGDKDSFFIIAADHTQYAGWAPQLIWDWLKNRES
jgi:hypothetical protein